MFVEQGTSESIIVAATNHPELLDKAIYRRFDDIIQFEKPGKDEIRQLIENRLALFNTDTLVWDRLTAAAEGLSSADVTRACEDAAKEAVLYHETRITTALIIKAIERRHMKKRN